MAITRRQAWLQYVTSRSAEKVYACVGDSYMSGAGGVSFADKLRASLSSPLVNYGVGSSTIEDIASYTRQLPWFFGRKFFLWDGAANSYGSVSSHLSFVDEILSFVGPGNLGALAPLSLGPPSGSTEAYLADMQAIYAGYGSKGIKTYDVQAYLVTLNDAADSTSTAEGLVGPASTQDGVHLTSSIMDSVVSKFVTDVIEANSW